jgi:Intracellular proteinase inhibitor
MPIFSQDGGRERCHNQARENGFHDRLILFVFNPSMNRPAIIFFALLFAAGDLRAQQTLFPTSGSATPSVTPTLSVTPIPTATPITTTTMKKRGLLGRMFHPFSSSDVLPKYGNRKLRGLILSLQISPQPVRLSEVRQMEVKLTVSNLGNNMVSLEFPTDQRIEVQLRNSADVVLTKWSENHAFKETPGSVLINPGEHIEYKELIATRDLTPGKVFTAEIFFPKYPELRIRQKFLTEP